MYHMQLVCFVTYDMNGCLILINLVKTSTFHKKHILIHFKVHIDSKAKLFKKKIGEGAEKIIGGEGQK